MTHRERMEAVFRGERPDVMPWFGDMTYWYEAHQTIGDLPIRWQGPNGLLELHKELNIGQYIPGCDPCDIIEGNDVQCEISECDGKRTSRWHTPIGTLQAVQEYSPISFSWGYTEHAVKDVDDLRVIRYLYEHRQYKPRPDRYLQFDESYRSYGFGPAHYAAPPTPISELCRHWIGVMDLSYLLSDEPDEMEQTFTAMGISFDKVYQHIASGPTSYVMVCENLSADTLGGHFTSHIAPHLRRWTGWLHEKNHKVLLHNDGRLRGTLEKLAEAGIDCVDSVVPHPVGDVAIDKLRELAGDEIILLGGLPGAMFAEPFTAKDIEKQVMEIIRFHKDSGRFMFGVADQVPPNGDLSLVKLVGDLVEKYGKY